MIMSDYSNSWIRLYYNFRIINNSRLNEYNLKKAFDELDDNSLHPPKSIIIADRLLYNLCSYQGPMYGIYLARNDPRLGSYYNKQIYDAMIFEACGAFNKNNLKDLIRFTIELDKQKIDIKRSFYMLGEQYHNIHTIQ